MKITKKYIRSIIDEYHAKNDSSTIIGFLSNDVFNQLKFFINETLAQMPDEYELSYENIIVVIDTLYDIYPKSSDNLKNIYEMRVKLLKDLQLHLAEISQVEVSTLDKNFINIHDVKYLFHSIYFLEKANLIDSSRKNLVKLLTLSDYNSDIYNALSKFSCNEILDRTKLDFTYKNVAIIKSFCQGYSLLAELIKRLEQASINGTLGHTLKNTSLNKLIDDLKTKERLLWEHPAHANNLAPAFISLALCQLDSDIKDQFYTAFIKYPEVSHLLALSLCLLYSMELDKSLTNRCEQLLNNIQYIPLITHSLFSLNLKIQGLRLYSIDTYEEINSHIEVKLDEIFSNPKILLQHIESPSKFLLPKYKEIIKKILKTEFFKPKKEETEINLENESVSPPAEENELNEQQTTNKL